LSLVVAAQAQTMVVAVVQAVYVAQKMQLVVVAV
jgi:hypothetical protein